MSEWYIGTRVAQSREDHTTTSIDAAIDFYYDLGALINVYGHEPSNASIVAQEYITHGMGKPRIWATNAVGVRDWWVLRSGVTITPSYSRSGSTATASVTIGGATDLNTAIEIVIPNWNVANAGAVQVLFDGASADPTNYRTTSYGLKVRVGATVSNVQVNYPVLQTWVQSDWSGGSGQGTWVDNTRYQSASGIDNGLVGQLGLSLTSSGNVLFADDFGAAASAPLPPWISQVGTWTVSNGMLQGSGADNQYANLYTSTVWTTDFSVEGRIQLPAGAFGGGISGRVDPATGARYAAWIYPAGSPGGSNVVKLVKFHDWTSWSGTPMQQVGVPDVGTGWHTLKIAFDGNRIRVYYDGNPVIDMVDTTMIRCQLTRAAASAWKCGQAPQPM